MLRGQLEAATADMDQTVHQMEALQAQINAGTLLRVAKCIDKLCLTDGGTSVVTDRIKDMTLKLREREQKAADAQRRADDAEQAAADRDRQLADVIARMRQYERVGFDERSTGHYYFYI
jgi:hypothetical protein